MFLLALLLAFQACDTSNGSKEKDKEGSAGAEKLKPQGPLFNRDSALAFAQHQLSFGPRVPGSEGHRKCGDWLVATFKRYGATVTEQTANIKDHKGKTLPMRNIVASYRPEASLRVFVSAHWDTRPVADQDQQRKDQPILGANDGASGVGVLLEMARLLAQRQPDIGIDLICWDAEDGGESEAENSFCLGSQYWGKTPHKAGYKAMYGINLDMVGAQDAVFPREGYSMKYAPQVVDKVWNMGRRLGYGAYFTLENTGGIIDDHVYVNQLAGIPTIDIIHLELNPAAQRTFFQHWHTHGDDGSVLSTEPLGAVGQTLVEVLYAEKLPQ